MGSPSQGGRLKVNDMMTRDVLTVDKDERLEHVLTLMSKYNVSKMPVVEKGKMVGVITDGDIADELGAIKNRGVPASSLHASSAMRRHYETINPDMDTADAVEVVKRDDVGLLPALHDGVILGIVTKADFLQFVLSDEPVQDFMITELHAVNPTDRVIHARRIMLDHGVERLPVLEGGKLVGIIAETDIAFGLAKFKDTVSTNHQNNQLKMFLVQDIMKRTVVTTAPTTPAKDAAHLMRERDIGGLPIQNGDGRIAGMITRTDLIRRIPSE